MAEVVITFSLKKEVFKRLKGDSIDVFKLMRSLEKNPHKGKVLSYVSGFVIKELKYKKFRFYFITDGQILKFGTDDELLDLLIRFVRMSDKKDQKKMIENIKNFLKSMGVESF